jgi:hypothetical protein
VPVRDNHWRQIAKFYNEGLEKADHKMARYLERYFNLLCKHPKPTGINELLINLGDAHCPEFVKKAKRFMVQIEIKDDQYNSAASSEDDTDSLSQDEHQDEKEDRERNQGDLMEIARPSFGLEEPNPDIILDIHSTEEITIVPSARKKRERSSSSSASQDEMSLAKRFGASKSRLGTIKKSGDDFLTENSPVAKVLLLLV